MNPAEMTPAEMKAECVRQLSLLAIPPDFDQLCKDGILERVDESKRQFKVLDSKRLPEHLWLRVVMLQMPMVEFADTVDGAKELLGRINPRVK